jgi:hypothetical protein
MANLGMVISAVIVLAELTGAAHADPVVSVTDRSNAGLDATERSAHVAAIQHAVTAWAEPSTDAANYDVSFTSLTVVTHGGNVAVAAQVRIAISDDHGVLRSVLAGAAHVDIAARHVHDYGLASLRHDALVAATEGVLHKLRPAIARR